MTLSHRTPIYYVDLTCRAGVTLAETVQSARDEMYARQLAGIDQVALDAAARQGFALGEFEESEEDGASVLEEFYSIQGEMQVNGVCDPEAVQVGNSVLADKLSQRASNNKARSI